MDFEHFPGGGTPIVLEEGLDAKILAFYGHMQGNRLPEAETTLLNLVAAYPDSTAFANMLPGLLATAVPRFLGAGSAHFTYADGSPLQFGPAFTPPEYTMAYLELMIHKNLLGHPAIPNGSAAHRTLSVMWEILLDIIPASRRAESIRRFDSYAPLPTNVVRFRKKTTH
ncbi:MAG TPA: hypothetical protein VIN59_01145 [Alphaproteobacteria bacterium]